MEVLHNMRWIVQEFLNGGSNYLRMVEALELLSVEYLIVSVDSKDNQLSVVDGDTKTFLDDSTSVLEEFIRDYDVMVYGSKLFTFISEDMDIKPGLFLTENFEFELLREYFGKELLNYNFMVGDLLTLNPQWDNFFIRPTGNDKLFDGMELSLTDFIEWQERESFETESIYCGKSLMIAPLRVINSEFRFFIVDGRIITGSSYKVGCDINTTETPSSELLLYAQKMVDLFPLARAYVIDIAETPDGYKIVEFNNINSSGLYGCDEIKMIEAINSMVF